MQVESTLPALPQIQTVAERFQTNLPQIQKGNEIAIRVLKSIQSAEIKTDADREEQVAKLTKVKDIYAKVNSLRVQVTEPIDQIKDYLMSFERPMDDKGKDNEYARAKAVITTYDQWKLDEKKKAELAAEQQRQLTVYKAELKAAVGKQLVEMLAGVKKTLIQGMAQWEKGLTLENFTAKEAEIAKPGSPALKMDKYEACFHTDFNRRHLLNEQLTKEYIESLKTDYPYEQFNNSYIEIVTEIKNSYRSRMGAIKVQLLEAKDNAEKEALRKAEIDAQDEANRLKVDNEASSALQQVESQKDMNLMEATFVQQAQTADLDAGPSGKKASFEKDSLWLKPLLEVISIVATSGKVQSIRNTKGEYIPAIQWWLTKYETLGKEVSGVKLTEVAKTIVRKKVE